MRIADINVYLKAHSLINTVLSTDGCLYHKTAFIRGKSIFPFNLNVNRFKPSNLKINIFKREKYHTRWFMKLKIYLHFSIIIKKFYAM